MSGLIFAGPAGAIDLFNALPAAMDQPRINAYFARTATGTPIVASGLGLDTFNVQAFYDTGASGLLLSNETADFLGIVRDTFNGQPIIDTDVGVTGTSDFNVSEPLHLWLAPYTQSVDVDNIATYQSVYNTRITGPLAGGALRTRIGPLGTVDPILANLDVIGMTAMRGKRVVMDNRLINQTLLNTIDTYVYTPGAPVTQGPGVPSTSHSIKLSYGDFDRFSQTSPVGAPGGSTWQNPFVGPNPARPAGTVDNTPAARLTLGTNASEASLLLDTGAAASILSKARALDLGVRYDPNTENTDSPTLLGVPLENQFTLTIGGIGGTKKIAGFFADNMLIRTEQGNAANINDANHLNFRGAPFLILDITIKDPVTLQDLTLDGILGMNYLTSSAFIQESTTPGDFPSFLDIRRGAFDFVVFDDVEGKLKVNYVEPTQGASWIGDQLTQTTGNWDVGTSFSWISGITFGTFQQGDATTFSDFALNFRVNILEEVRPSSVVFDLSDAETSYTLRGVGRISGTGTFTLRGAGRVRVETQNTYTGSTVVEGGILTFAVPQNIGPVVVLANGELNMETSQRFGGLRVDGNARTTSPDRQVIITPSLIVSAQGRLEIGNDGIAVDFDPDNPVDQTDIRLAIRSGRNAVPASPWTGHGITSSVAAGDARQGVGYALASLVSTAAQVAFFGQSFDSSTLLIRPTLLGDTNLDSAVNFNDLVNLARSFNKPGVWAAGDSNYDGLVDFNDLVLIARNFNLTITPSGIVAPVSGGGADFPSELARAFASVPEPTTLMLGAMAGSVLLRRRHR